jgi:hypothetical protein
MSLYLEPDTDRSEKYRISKQALVPIRTLLQLVSTRRPPYLQFRRFPLKAEATLLDFRSRPRIRIHTPAQSLFAQHTHAGASTVHSNGKPSSIELMLPYRYKGQIQRPRTSHKTVRPSDQTPAFPGETMMSRTA